MFNIGSGEIALIAVVALLVLGPSRLPELARGIGKFVREFRRQTDEVRGVVEREFYRMDAPPPPPSKLHDLPLPVRPAQDSVAVGADDALPPPAQDVSGSQVTRGMPASSAEPVAQAPAPGNDPKPQS